MKSKVRSKTVQRGGGKEQANTGADQTVFPHIHEFHFSLPPTPSFRFALTTPSFVGGGSYSNLVNSLIPSFIKKVPPILLSFWATLKLRMKHALECPTGAQKTR